MKRIYGCLLVLLTILVGASSSITVSAESVLDDQVLTEYSQNNIMFYAPCDENSSEEIEGAGLLAGKDNKERVWNWFVNAGIEGVSDNPVVIAGIMGNIGKESGYNPFAKNSSGYYGLYQEDSADMRNYVEGKIGTVDWGSSIDDAEKNSAAIAAELEWLKEHDDFKEFANSLDVPDSKDGAEGAKAYAELFLVRYERAVGGSDAIEDSGVYSYMQKMYNGTTYLYQNAKGRRDEAEDVYNYAQENGASLSSTSDSSGSSNPACNACEEGSMNINGAAACLAWPLGTDSSKYVWNGGSGNPLFQEAYEKIFPGRASGPNCQDKGASCDVFTSTVVRYSGYDPDFPRWVAIDEGEGDNYQYWYAKNHPDKWEVFEWDGKKSSVKGGDVMLAYDPGGHSYVAVQDENGELYKAEAGICAKYGMIEEWGSGDIRGRNYILRPTQAQNSNVGVDVKNGVKSSSTTGTLTSGTGQNNGDINATAFDLAWPEGTPSSTYSNSLWDKWVEAYDSLPGRKNTRDNSNWRDGRSCMVFVNTVLLYAGALSNDSKNSSATPSILKSDEWEEVGGEGSVGVTFGDLEPGDVLAYYDGGKASDDGTYYKGLGLKHEAIYGENENGEGKIIQAGFLQNYGHVDEAKDKSSKLTGWASVVRVFRWKNKKSGSACDLCDSGSGGAQLKAGGFDTVEEATAFMQSYIDAASTPQPNGYYDYSIKGEILFGVKNGMVHDAGCPHGVLANCVAFSQWFVNNYTTIGPNWNGTTNGVGLVDALVKAGLKRGDDGLSPHPYAIFSTDGPTEDGHTGVILGVNKEARKVIVGDAACNEKSRVFYKPRAYELSFDEIKNWWYAYTDDKLSMGGPLRHV